MKHWITALPFAGHRYWSTGEIPVWCATTKATIYLSGSVTQQSKILVSMQSKASILNGLYGCVLASYARTDSMAWHYYPKIGWRSSKVGEF